MNTIPITKRGKLSVKLTADEKETLNNAIEVLRTFRSHFGILDDSYELFKNNGYFGCGSSRNVFCVISTLEDLIDANDIHID